MSSRVECFELIRMIEQDYYDSLPYFYKNLYEVLLDFIYQFENNLDEEYEPETY